MGVALAGKNQFILLFERYDVTSGETLCWRGKR